MFLGTIYIIIINTKSQHLFQNDFKDITSQRNKKRNIKFTISNKNLYPATDNKNKKMYHIDFYQNRSKPTASKMHKKLYILNIIDNFFYRITPIFGFIVEAETLLLPLNKT